MNVNEKEWKELKRKEKILRKIAVPLNIEEKVVPNVITRFQNELKEAEEELKKIRK